MFWKKEKKEDSQSLPLDKQVETSHQRILDRNLKFSLDFRIGISLFMFPMFLLYSWFNGIGVANALPISITILAYGIANVIGKLLVNSGKSYGKFMGYFIPCFEILLVSSALKWLNPFGPPLLFFGSDNVLFAVILANAALHTNRHQIAFVTTFLCVVHFGFQLSELTPEVRTKYATTDLFQLINPFEFAWYSFYYALMGVAMYFKTRESEAISDDIRDIWIPKILGGAYGDMTDSESVPSTETHSIFAVTQHPDKYIGADYFRAEKVGNKLALVVGDVVSHGLNVSQGALVCLSAFSALENKDPRRVLEAINRALIPIKQEHGGETFAMAFMFHPDGTVEYNGYLDELCIMRVSKGEVIRIEAAREGELLGKNKDHVIPQNKTLKMYDHDNLVVLTDGAKNGDEEDDKTSVIVTYFSGKKRRKKL